MRAYKFLRAGAVGPFTQFRWPLPGGGAPAPWVAAAGRVAQCENGIHACRVRDLPYWLDEELWAIELDGEIDATAHQVTASRARLLGRVESWSRVTAAELAELSMVRARDVAARILRACGLEPEAERLSAAAAPAAIDGAARDAQRAAERAQVVPATQAAFLAGAAARHAIPDPAGVDYACYAALTAFSAAQAAGVADPVAGYGDERLWQASWLSERLGLGAGR